MFAWHGGFVRNSGPEGVVKPERFYSRCEEGWEIGGKTREDKRLRTGGQKTEKLVEACARALPSASRERLLVSCW